MSPRELTDSHEERVKLTFRSHTVWQAAEVHNQGTAHTCGSPQLPLPPFFRGRFLLKKGALSPRGLLAVALYSHLVSILHAN